MRPVTLRIFHHNDESFQLKELGLAYSITDCEIRDVRFYNITAISKYIEDGVQYTSIHSNGTEYICADEMNTVILQIEKL